MSAPRSMRSCTTSLWPFQPARIKVLLPSCDHASADQPHRPASTPTREATAPLPARRRALPPADPAPTRPRPRRPRRCPRRHSRARHASPRMTAPAPPPPTRPPPARPRPPRASPSPDPTARTRTSRGGGPPAAVPHRSHEGDTGGSVASRYALRSHRVGGLDVGAAVDEELRHILVAIHGGHHQCRAPTLRSRIGRPATPPRIDPHTRSPQQHFAWCMPIALGCDPRASIAGMES